MATQENEKRPNGFEFLTPDEVDMWRDFYAGVAARCVVVGYATQRRQTWIDLQTIADVKSFAEEGSVSFASLARLEAIITGGGERSLFAKVMAAIYYGRYTYERGTPAENSAQLLANAMATEPDAGGEIIAGALLAGTMLACCRDDHDFEASALESIFGGLKPANRQQEVVKIGIDQAKAVIASMFTERELNLQFALASVAGGPIQEYQSESILMSGYPHTIMHLEEGDLPSLDKMAEAARLGMPESTSFVLRAPRLLCGVELSAKVPASLRLEYRPSVRLLHVHLGVLEVPKSPAGEVFANETDWNTDQVAAHASFDALSQWVAIQISRRLEKAFGEIENSDLTPFDKEKRQHAAMNAALREWLILPAEQSSLRPRRAGLLLQPVGYKPDGTPVSILSRAVEERARYGGAWDIESARVHLIHTCQAMALISENGHLRVRPPDQIRALYREYIWQSLLTDQDKVAFALALLSDPESAHWRSIPDYIQGHIAQVIHGHYGTELNPKVFEWLRDYMNRNRDSLFIFRWETVRDRAYPAAIESIPS